MLIRERVARFTNRVLKSRYGIWIEDSGLVLPVHNNILAVLGTVEGKYLIGAANIVTTAGDVWYAQRACTETPTNTFNNHVMCSAGPATPAKADDYDLYTAIAGSNQANDGTYPKTADADADNTGAGTDIVTHRVSYTAASFSGTITHGLITIASPVVDSPILTGYAFTSFSKTTSDTLKVFVNHNVTGS